MKKSAILAFSFVSVLLCGCESEVDKCVAAWDIANPGPDNEGDYCRASDRRSFDDNKCTVGTAQTKGQVKASIRLECLKASK